MITQTILQAFSSSLFLNIFLLGVFSSLLVSLSAVLIEYNDLSGVSGPIAHTILGGVGGALFFGVDPFIGVFIVCIIESIILTFVKIKVPKSLESVSNALWGLGMSLGVLFLFLTPGYQQSLSNFLFGNILLVSHKDIIQSFILDLIVFFFIVIFSKQILVVMINIEFAKLQKIPYFFFLMLMMMIISFSIMSLVRTVGIVLSLVLLTTPFHIVKNLTQKSLLLIIVLTFCIALLSILLGLFLSFSFNLPSGSSIALACFSFYWLLLVKKLMIFIKRKKNPYLL